MDISNRKFVFGDSGCTNYKQIKEYKDRYIASYMEYLVKLKFCLTSSEFINKEDLDKVLDFVNNFKYTEEVKKELRELGYFEKIKN